MKMRFLILLVLGSGLTTFAVHSESFWSESYWIVGDDYVAHSEHAKSPSVTPNVKSSSWGFDADRCQLWVSDEVSHTLRIFSRFSEPIALGKAEKILSDGQFGKFLTLTPDLKLNVRNHEGHILKTWDAPWAATALRILTSANEGQTWSLHQDLSANRLWIEGRDAEWNLKKQITVSNGVDLWGNTRLQVDVVHKKLWIGYAKTALKHVYQPYIQRYDFDGKLEMEQTWNNRGLFFDSCLDEAGNLLASRDVPSPAFTVPVYSYLERVPLVGKSSTVLALETNDFADSLLCRPQHIDFIARSIFPSDQPKVMTWNGKAGAVPEKLFVLPSKASQLYSCNVE